LEYYLEIKRTFITNIGAPLFLFNILNPEKRLIKLGRNAAKLTKMYITKDIHRLFYEMLEDSKFEYAEKFSENKAEQLKFINSFDNLIKLNIKYANDERRKGRKSNNSFADLIKRISKKY